MKRAAITASVAIALLAGLLRMTWEEQRPPAPKPSPQVAPPAQPPAPVRVWGRVVDSAGAPLTGATVRCDDTAVLTDATGAYRCPPWDPGKHSLMAHKSGYFDLRETGVGRVGLRVGPKTSAGPWTLTLRKPANVSGHVVSGAAPQAGASVDVTYLLARGLREDLKRFRLTGVTKTDAHGRFSLPSLPAGRLWIEATTVSGGTARTPVFDLRPGERRPRLLLRVQATAGLHVRALGRADIGVAATVKVYRADALEPVERRTDAQGSARFEGLPSGSWRVVVEARGHFPATIDSLALPPHGQITQIVRLTARKGVVGRVLGPARKAVTAAAVRLSCGNGAETVYSSADGSFHWAEAQAPCETHGTHPRYGDASPQLAHAGEVVELQLQRGGHLSGSVIDAQERPCPTAIVQVTARQLGDAWTTVNIAPAHAQPDGSWVIGALRPGRYRVTARAAGYPPAVPVEVEVRGGSQAEAEIALSGGAKLYGKVTDATGLAVADAEVALQGPQERWVAITGPDGAYALEAIPAGNYALTATHPLQIPARRHSVEVPAQGELRIDLKTPTQRWSRELPSIGATLEDSPTGYQFTKVTADGPLAAAGVKAGEHLVAVEFQRPETLAPDVLAQSVSGGSVQITLEVRDDEGGVRSVYVDPK